MILFALRWDTVSTGKYNTNFGAIEIQLSMLFVTLIKINLKRERFWYQGWSGMQKTDESAGLEGRRPERKRGGKFNRHPRPTLDLLIL